MVNVIIKENSKDAVMFSLLSLTNNSRFFTMLVSKCNADLVV